MTDTRPLPCPFCSAIPDIEFSYPHARKAAAITAWNARVLASRDPEAAKLEMLVAALKDISNFAWNRTNEAPGFGLIGRSADYALEQFNRDAALGAANTPEQQA